MKQPIVLLGAMCLLLASSAIAQGVIADESESLASVRRVLVPPVARNDTTNLVDLGMIETDGFSSLTLNLAGETTDVLRSGGTIGAILIPAIEPYESAFKNRGLLPVSLEISAALRAGSNPEFMAKQLRVAIGFPRYRVLVYNTTSHAANISFFAYRTRD